MINNNPKQDQTLTMADQQHAMDDPQENLQNMKSLSVMLLKETIERRQQVESLLQAKHNLEIQLGHIAAEKTDSGTEFVRKSEDSMSLETIKGVFSVFFENQMDTMGVMLRNLVRENGEKENLIGFLKAENNELKVKLEREREKSIAFEEKKIHAEDEIKKLNDHYNQSLEYLKEKKEQFDDLNRNFGELRWENDEIISSFRYKLIELEKSYENASSMANSLGEEKNEKEITIGKLMEEMDSRERLVKNLNAELKDKEGLIETLLREKEEIEDVKVSKENGIAKLNTELVGLRNAGVEMQEFIKIQQDRNTRLRYEVGQVKIEKRRAEILLDNETNINKDLVYRVSEMEKRVEESVQELAKMMKQNENLSEEKRGVECQVVLLRKEKDFVLKTLEEAQREANDLRKKLESVTLIMLKKAAEMFLVNGKKLLSGTELRRVHDIKRFATELEVVKIAFRSKETAVKGIKFLQNAVIKASKPDSLADAVAFTIYACFSICSGFIIWYICYIMCVF